MDEPTYQGSVVDSNHLLQGFNPWMGEGSPQVVTGQNGEDDRASHTSGQIQVSQILLWKQLQRKQNYLQSWNV